MLQIVLFAAALVAPQVPAQPQAPSCLPAAQIQRLERVDNHRVTVISDSGAKALTLDPTCAGVDENLPMQLATPGELCADGRSAVITAKAICPVTAVAQADQPTCFRIDRISSYSMRSGSQLEVRLRSGDRFIADLESNCGQLERFGRAEFRSARGDGRVCGGGRDYVFGRLDEEDNIGVALGGGFARQLNRNDLASCQIMAVRPSSGTPKQTD